MDDSKCEPKLCYELNERIAIMQYDGNMSNSKTRAVQDVCSSCERRNGKRGWKILKEIGD